jgi:hypothetical protein
VRREARFHEALLYLRIDSVQPLLGALSLLLVLFEFSLKLCNPMLGRTELVRKLPRCIHRKSVVLLNNIGSLVKELEDCLPRLTKPTVSAELTSLCCAILGLPRRTSLHYSSCRTLGPRPCGYVGFF